MLDEMEKALGESLGMQCPGCDKELNGLNLGGYRSFCDICTEAMGAPPKTVDKKGFVEGYRITGKRPNFKWVKVEN